MEQRRFMASQQGTQPLQQLAGRVGQPSVPRGWGFQAAAANDECLGHRARGGEEQQGSVWELVPPGGVSAQGSREELHIPRRRGDKGDRVARQQLGPEPGEHWGAEPLRNGRKVTFWQGWRGLSPRDAPKDREGSTAPAVRAKGAWGRDAQRVWGLPLAQGTDRSTWQWGGFRDSTHRSMLTCLRLRAPSSVPLCPTGCLVGSH